jgi:hypothetical protein
MASPFHYFRQHQKVIMVAVIGLSMFSFIVLDSINSNREALQQSLPAVMGLMFGIIAGWILGYKTKSVWAYVTCCGLLGAMLTTYFGSKVDLTDPSNKSGISTYKLNQLVQEQQLANAIVDNFQAIAMGGRSMGNQNYFSMSRNDDPRNNAILTEAYKEEADQMGMVVPDQFIADFIVRASYKQMNKTQFAQMLSQMHMSEDDLYDVLRTQLKAQNCMQIVTARNLASPYTFWSGFRKLNQHAEADIVQLSVKNFVDKVPEPTEAELKDFFEQNKNVFPGEKGEGTVGFRFPDRAQLAYIEVDYLTTEKTIPEITDQEVEDFYNKNKELFPVNIFDMDVTAPAGAGTPPNMPPSSVPPTTPEMTPPATTPPATTPPTTPPVTEKPVTEKPATPPEAPKVEAPKADAPKADAPKTEAPKATETPTTPEAPKTPEKPVEPTTPQSRYVPGLNLWEYTTRFWQVSYQPEQPATEKPAETPAATTPPVVTPPVVTPPETKTPPVTTPEVTTPPATTPPVTTPPATPPEMTLPSLPPTTPPVAPKIRPLDEDLKKQIRENLLRQRTLAKMQQQAEQIQGMMYELGADASLPKDDPNHKTEAQVREGIIEFAKKNGMHASETPLLSQRELADSADYPIGKCVTPAPANQDNAFPASTSTVPELVFVDMAEQTLRATAVEDPETKNRFVFWTTKFTPSHVPTFDEPGVKEIVTKTWKSVKARDIVKKRGQEIIDLVKKSDKPITELLADQTETGTPSSPQLVVGTTGLFTWLSESTVPSNSMMPRANVEVTPVPSVVGGAGDTFMAEVFNNLQPGEYGIAPNVDHSCYFIIKVISKDKPETLYDKMLKTESWSGQFGRSMQALQQESREKLMETQQNEILAKHKLHLLTAEDLSNKNNN